MQEERELLLKLDVKHRLKSEEWKVLLRCENDKVASFAAELARRRSKRCSEIKCLRVG